MHRADAILVTGATGSQGGAVARELLDGGFRVRALTRDPQSPTARALELAGAELVRGDLEDAASVDAALRGAAGVFSVQLPDMSGKDRERRHGFTLIRCALTAGVRHFVHTSVTSAGNHTRFPRWETSCWNREYWTAKWDVEEAVRGAGFPCWTILKPAFLMDNFAVPKAHFMFPDLARGEIATALHVGTRMQLIAADDVGAFARAAFERPAELDRRSIDLASEALTMVEVAQVLSTVLGTRVVSVELSPEQALARGMNPGWVRSQEWTNEVGYRADIAALRAYGVSLTPFAEWVHRHRNRIIVNAA